MPKLIDAGEDEEEVKEHGEKEFKQLAAVMEGQRTGKTRLEALKELDYDPVELLPGGEIRLPSGKIIGHRDYKYIYRQRLKPTDDREQVVIQRL
jgi:hypothetical protein